LTGDFILPGCSTAAETDNVRTAVLLSKTLATIVNGEINQMFESASSSTGWRMKTDLPRQDPV
jgi:hypothetical protein